ncbi:Uncharacterised protein [Leclercia adecarboxylata]|uniref:Uncharacterized protein n=1 Tax=Leclercia adecarboxylata TaxID=83655 RepID=A0A4U9HVE4_9ENTR|nr:Uncharacterised protein [Leclercia adecarboxylata]
MKKYQRLAQQIISQIELGVWQPAINCLPCVSR